MKVISMDNKMVYNMLTTDVNQQKSLCVKEKSYLGKGIFLKGGTIRITPEQYEEFQGKLYHLH